MPAPIETRREEGVTSLLFDAGTLFHLFIGRWTANKKMHERDLLLEEIDSSAFYIGHKKLLPPEAQKELQFIEGQARSFLAGHSVPFPIGNARFVTYNALREVLTRLERFKEEWGLEVEALVKSYPTYKEEQLKTLDRQAQVLADKELAKTAPYAVAAKRAQLKEWVEGQKKVNRSLYLEAEDLRSRFVFEWRMFKLSPLVGSEEMSTLDAATLFAEQDRIKQDLNRWVGEVSVLMHKELGEAAAQARKLLQDNGKLNPRNLKPLFDAFETFSAVNFAGPSEFQNVIDSIRARYLQKTGEGETDWKLTADKVNHSTEEMRRLLDGISGLALDNTAQQAGLNTVRAGRFSRVVELD